MQVQAINIMSNSYSNKISRNVKVVKHNFNPSFRSLYIDGEIIMKASEAQVREYAEMLHTLPDSAIKSLTNAYGFMHKKHQVSNNAYNRLSVAIKEVKDEIKVLEESKSPEAKKRLWKLYNAAEEGAKEYYQESESSETTLYQDTLDGMVEDIRSNI